MNQKPRKRAPNINHEATRRLRNALKKYTKEEDVAFGFYKMMGMTEKDFQSKEEWRIAMRIPLEDNPKPAKRAKITNKPKETRKGPPKKVMPSSVVEYLELKLEHYDNDEEKYKEETDKIEKGVIGIDYRKSMKRIKEGKTPERSQVKKYGWPDNNMPDSDSDSEWD